MLMVRSSLQGYGAISPSSPELDEQAFFDDIIERPLVAEKPAVKQRKSWESAMSSNKTQRFVSIPPLLVTPKPHSIAAWSDRLLHDNVNV